MKIGYCVQGDADEAVVRGLADRWCPSAELAQGLFRGSSRESFRREIRKALLDLKDSKACGALVVLTDADANRWQEVGCMARRGQGTRIDDLPMRRPGESLSVRAGGRGAGPRTSLASVLASSAPASPRGGRGAGPGHQPYCPFDTRSNESRTSSRSTPVSTSSSFLM